MTVDSDCASGGTSPKYRGIRLKTIRLQLGAFSDTALSFGKAHIGRAVATTCVVLGIAAVARAQSADGFNPGANAGVNAIAIQPDAKVLVGGAFTMLGGGGTGTTPRSYLGRLAADGSLDAS